MADDDVLTTHDVSKAFGGMQALRDVSLTVRKASVLGIIGPNGAGKSTLVNVISGLQSPDSGTVIINGKRFTRSGVSRRARYGMGRTFQTPAVFPDITVADNLQTCQVAPTQRGKNDSARMGEFIDVFQLGDCLEQLAGDMRTYDQQRLAILMACLRGPELVLLDEPSGGLVGREVDELAHLVEWIRASGRGVVLIDHKMRLMTRLSDYLLAMAQGVVIKSGVPEDVINDDEVAQTYLGIAPDADIGEIDGSAIDAR